MISRIWKGREVEGCETDKGKMTWFIETCFFDGLEVVSKLIELNEKPTRIYLGAGRTDIVSWSNLDYFLSYVSNNDIEVVVECDSTFYSQLPQQVIDNFRIVLSLRFDTISDHNSFSFDNVAYFKVDDYKNVFMWKPQNISKIHVNELSTLKNCIYEGEDVILYQGVAND